jgi:RNA polymerase sigma factor (sigma-70 family)
MPGRDWDSILKDEDRRIANSDRKHRAHFNSLEAMSEELVHKHSMDRHCRFELDGGADTSPQNPKLASAMKRLTERQRQAVELYYWQRYSQKEIAALFKCRQQTVSDTLQKAVKKLKRLMSVPG